MTGVFLGAVLGALFGYAASHWQGRQEERARRHALFRVLSQQLHGPPLESPDFSPEVILTRGTIHVSAADQLLAGHVLDSKKDEILIMRLVLWQSFEAHYNESVSVFNQAAISASLSEIHHPLWHLNLEKALIVLREWRPIVLRALPPDYRSSGSLSRRESPAD